MQTTRSRLGCFELRKTGSAGPSAASHASVMPGQETRGETWDARIRKLLGQTPEAGEVDTTVNRVNPFFASIEVPPKTRETTAHAPAPCAAHAPAPCAATRAAQQKPTAEVSRDIHVEILVLCRFAPYAVKRFLQEAKVGYHLTRTLFYCRYHGVFDAEASILEKMGQASEALSVCINAYSVLLKNEEARRMDSPASKLSSLNKTRADDIVASAVGVCFRDSLNATQNVCLWTKLLSSLTVHLRHGTEALVRALVESHVCAVLRAASTLASDVLTDGVLREGFEDEAALQDFRLSLSRILTSTRVKLNYGEIKAEDRERAKDAACQKHGGGSGKCVKLSSSLYAV